MYKYNLKHGVVLFGTGDIYRRFYDKLRDMPIVALLDNSSEKQGKLMNGVKVSTPEQLDQIEYDAVILMSDAWPIMKKQLLDLGIADDVIVPYTEIDTLRYKMSERSEIIRQYNAIIEEYKKWRGKKALLISNQMDFSGAPMTMLHTARVLNKNGYKVVVISREKGGLKCVFERENVPVIYDEFLIADNREIWDLASVTDIVIINTLLISGLIYGVKNTNTKCIWWIHESDERCAPIDDADLVNSMPANLKVYGVGKRVIDTLSNYDSWKTKKVESLLFGIPDDAALSFGNENEKIIFAVIGYYMPNKGQDIFIEAIKSLPEAAAEQCEFWMVGKTLDSEYYQTLAARTENDERIRFFGSKNRDEMRELYSKIDVLVCASRRESMSAVTIEAMMNSKLCIVARRAGIANYILDGQNGYIFETEDAKDLACKMKYIIQNYNSLYGIKREARKTYEENFSMEIFEKNLMRAVEYV